jgi:hypothetical protein
MSCSMHAYRNVVYHSYFKDGHYLLKLGLVQESIGGGPCLPFMCICCCAPRGSPGENTAGIANRGRAPSLCLVSCHFVQKASRGAPLLILAGVGQSSQRAGSNATREGSFSHGVEESHFVKIYAWLDGADYGTCPSLDMRFHPCRPK